MNRDEILKIVNKVMDNYELGSDHHMLYIEDNKLKFSSVMYEWYNIELKNESPEELLRAIIEIIMDWTFEIDFYKE